MHTQILILGSGPAGLTAALYSALAGFQTTVLTGVTSGGQLTLTNEIENFPGLSHISGIDLTDRIRIQAEQAGATFISDTANHIDLSQSPFVIYASTPSPYTANALIIATGAFARRLHIPGEDKFWGHGISVCATCDGVFYRNKTIAIVGGGNSAAYEALFLSQTAEKIYLIIRESQLSADIKIQEQIKARPNIILIPDTQILEIKGDTHLNSLLLKNLKSGKQQSLSVQGLFEAVGRIPDSDLFKGQLIMDSQGYIITDCRTGETSHFGVFACGDVGDPLYHQAILACGSGCRAALSAKKYLLSAFN